MLEEEANTLAKETGSFNGNGSSREPTRAQTLIFGWLAESEISLDGLTKVAGRREVEITASWLHQRFTREAAAFLQRLLQRLTQVRLAAESAPVALLKQFVAVIVEDSSRIHLPDDLAGVWRGCGGSAGSSQVTLKLFVRWNVLSGELQGPLLTDGKQADAKSPFKEQDVPAGGLYLPPRAEEGSKRLRSANACPLARLTSLVNSRARFACALAHPSARAQPASRQRREGPLVVDGVEGILGKLLGGLVVAIPDAPPVFDWLAAELSIWEMVRLVAPPKALLAFSYVPLQEAVPAVESSIWQMEVRSIVTPPDGCRGGRARQAAGNRDSQGFPCPGV